jgi:hypothetical protein
MVKNISYQQSRSNRSRLLHRQVGAFLQEDPFVDEKSVLERGELVLAQRRTAIDMVTGFQFRAVRANFENDAGTVAADNRRPLVDEEAGVLLQSLAGLVSVNVSCCRMREGVAHTGLIPTARHFTSACFGPGVERGRLLTTV